MKKLLLLFFAALMTIAVNAQERMIVEQKNGSFVEYNVSDLKRVRFVTQDWFEVTPTSLYFGADEGENQMLDISTNLLWQIMDIPSWLTVSDRVGNGDKEVVLTTNSTSSERRSGSFYVLANGQLYPISVSQEAKKIEPKLTVSPEVKNVGEGSAIFDVAVTANVPWIAACSEAWVKLSSNSGMESKTISVSIEENTSNTSRTATVTFSGGDMTANLVITQDAKSIVPQIRVETEVIEMPSGAAVSQNGIISNISWKVTCTENWLTILPMEGQNDATITIRTTANQSEQPRTATVSISGAGKTATFLVKQEGKTPDPYITVSSSDINVNSGSTIVSNTISSNVAWTAKSSQSWATLSKTSGEGDATINVSVSSNKTVDNRSATITITGGGKTASFTINQEGDEETLSVTSASLYAGSGASTVNNYVTSNTSWTASCNYSWVHLSRNYYDGSTNLACDIDANTSTNERTATVTISTNRKTVTFTITQEGVKETKLFDEPYVNWGVSRTTVSSVVQSRGYQLQYSETSSDKAYCLSFYGKDKEIYDRYFFDDSMKLLFARVILSASSETMSNIGSYMTSKLGYSYKGKNSDGDEVYLSSDQKTVAFLYLGEFSDTHEKINIVDFQEYNPAPSVKTIFEEPYVNWGASRSTVNSAMTSRGYKLIGQSSSAEENYYLLYDGKDMEFYSMYYFDTSISLIHINMIFEQSSATLSDVENYAKNTLGYTYAGQGSKGEDVYMSKDKKTIVFIYSSEFSDTHEKIVIAGFQKNTSSSAAGPSIQSLGAMNMNFKASDVHARKKNPTFRNIQKMDFGSVFDIIKK